MYSTLILVPQIWRRPLTASPAPSHRLMQVFVINSEFAESTHLLYILQEDIILKAYNLNIHKRICNPQNTP